MFCCCLRSIQDTVSDDSSTFMEKKDKELPFAEAVVADEPLKAELDEPTDPETFYGKFNYPFIIGEADRDKALAGRAESPNDRIVDLLLIMDCTSSMSTWLRLCRKTLKDAVTSLKEENPDLEVRVAFLGYRDITDKENIFTIQDFTFDIEHIKTLISETPARGGGDVPEDVQGALYQGLKLSWRNVSVKIAYLCTDAPCHGKAYHSLRDNFPDGNPAGLELEELMKQYSDRGIDFTAYQLTGQTRNMYNIMEKAYDEGENKGQMGRIALEKEIKQAEVSGDVMDDYEEEEDKGFISLREAPPAMKSMEMRSPRMKSKKKNKKMKSKSSFLENAYAVNFTNDLRSRAQVQYARHGWI